MGASHEKGSFNCFSEKMIHSYVQKARDPIVPEG